MSARWLPEPNSAFEPRPLAGEVLDIEPVSPPWPGAERLGPLLGAAWWYSEVACRIALRYARIILPPVLRCSAHLVIWLPARAALLVAAEITRRLD